MAVQFGEKWKLYDVTATNEPAGMLTWSEEGMQALVSDPKQPFFIASPLSTADASTCQRIARFALDGDGTLEGDAGEVCSGHSAAHLRRDMEEQNDAQRLEHIQDGIHKRFADAEVSKIVVEGIDDPEVPVKIRYHVKIPGYAERTGKRLLLQPFYFERGVAPRFSEGERKYSLEFPFAWKEMDRITIKLPGGFTLDNAEKIGGLNFGRPGHYDVSMSINAAHELVIARDLVFGDNGSLQFLTNVYPQVAKVFAAVHQRDNQSISFKVAPAAVPNTPASVKQ